MELMEHERLGREEVNTAQESPEGRRILRQEGVESGLQHSPGHAVEEILKEVLARVDVATREADD